MIPSKALDEWQRVVPWTSPHEIEQDLVLTRLIAELARHPVVGGSLDLTENVTMAAALIDVCAAATQPAQSWRRVLSSEGTASDILGAGSKALRTGSRTNTPSAADAGEK